MADFWNGKLVLRDPLDPSKLVTTTTSGASIGLDVNIIGGTISIDTTGLATSALQLPDGHNVTVDNGAGAAAVNIQDGGNTITVDGTVTANTGLTQPLTDTQLRASAVPVSLASVPSHEVTNAGTFATQATLQTGSAAIGKLAANSGVDIGDVDVTSIPGMVGTVADDATTPGAPVMIGGSAVETDGTDPTSVSAEADVARVRTDRNRRMLVNTFHPNLWTITPAAYSTAQTNASVKAAPGANLSLYITDIFVSNGATAGIITLLDGSGGTVIFRAYTAINGGAVLNLMTPIRLTANTALCITSTTVTTHSVTISGFIAP